ncbi:geranylgeranyl diphosphate synthase, type III [Kwoniella mangroviensis CBS 10435]|uniref:(2E,6E)-farnesyl diphosphate synthase n=1 Tax=Kwoniella mangroviensis CBS 10435 TaxID=1331196 RepID=A0A1B9IHN8_9TREE|nr:geranylgeranyl diphosphate synthase, type III [Kwoniella mangroviensis CBS 10435]
MDYSNLRKTLHKPVWSDTQERTLLEPYTYISANPGKEFRGKLIDAFNIWLKVPEEDLKVVTRIVRMLHNASLLMDDVEDNSELRRGLPVAHTIYGIPQTINTANYVYFLAMQELLSLRDTTSKGKKKDVDVVGLVTDELLHLHRGQGLDLFWRDTLTCPTEKEYVDMVLGKAGGLLRLAVKLMMAKSESGVDYVPLVNLISVWFQIRDDYMNLQSTEYEANKGYCEDLTEGKFSFPVVHGVRADDSNRQILNVLQKKTTSVSLKKHVVDHLRDETKSFEYTKKIIIDLQNQIQDEIKDLGGNKYLEMAIRSLALKEDE